MILLSTLPIFSYQYGIPYFVLIIIIILLSKLQKSDREGSGKIVYILSFILILFFGLRGFIQTDWVNYYNLFNKLPPIWEIKDYNNNEDFEIGFLLYTSLIKSIFPDFHIWVFINSVIDILIFTWFFKKYSSSIFLSWIVFLIFSGLVMELNLYRNVKAICLFLLSIPYIEQRRFGYFIILWVLAILFHNSSFLYLPAYFILTKDWGRVMPLVLLTFVNIIFFFNLYPTSLLINYLAGSDAVFATKALSYFSTGADQGISLGYIERLTTFLLCVFLSNKLVSDRKSNRVFINSFYIYYCLWYIFSDVSIFVERFPVLFSYAYWILLPNMINIAHKTYRKLFQELLIIFLFVKVFILTDHILYRYDNILFGIDSNFDREIDISRYLSSVKS